MRNPPRTLVNLLFDDIHLSKSPQWDLGVRYWEGFVMIVDYHTILVVVLFLNIFTFLLSKLGFHVPFNSKGVEPTHRW